MRIKDLISNCLSVLCVIFILPVSAQQGAIEEIIVTGSYLKKKSQFDSASPIASVGQENLTDYGPVTFEDVINNLAINSGTFNRQDTFNNTFTTGAGNINLRGLGASSTLVLLNSHRTVRSSSFGNKGENFVDINSLVPMIAIEEVEILKDGASALYGTDAVAGVTNFKTRNNFRGAELQADYQVIHDGGQQDFTISGIYGAGTERANFMAAFSYLDRTDLGTDKRRDEFYAARTRHGTATTIFSSPGTFGLFATTGVLTAPGIATGPTPATTAAHAAAVAANGPFSVNTFADPRCAAVSAIDQNFFQGTHHPVSLQGVCLSEFGNDFSLVPEEERIQGFTHFDYAISDDVEFFIEGSFAINDARVDLPASEPLLNAPLIPSFHPDNPFGVDALWLGRPAGHGSDLREERFDNNTWRIHTGITGAISENWDFDIALTYGENEYDFFDNTDLKKDRVAAALFGAGGPNNNQFYNPFALASENDPAVLNDLYADYTSDAKAKTTVVDAVFSNNSFINLWGQDIGLAAGFQYRHDSLKAVYSEDAQNYNLAFFIGNENFSGNEDAFAGFFELAIPVMDNVTLQFALRHEELEDTSTTDPKVGLLWLVNEQLSLRGSFGTAFRAPSLFQVYGSTNAPLRLSTQGNSTISQLTKADPNNPLQPEEADVYNFGVTWNPQNNFSLGFDYWRFEYENVIIVQSSEALVATNPTSPQIIRGIIGITNVTTFFTNAPQLDTDGVDISARYSLDSQYGLFTFSADATRILSYDMVDPLIGDIDGLGRRNFENFGSPTPEWRFNLGFGWERDRHAFNLTMRYIDSYTDNRPYAHQAPFDARPVEVGIDSHTTLDLQYSYQLPQLGGFDNTSPVITIGSNNVLDEMPPPVASRSGFDPAVHDSRGATYYARLKIPFDI